MTDRIWVNLDYKANKLKKKDFKKLEKYIDEISKIIGVKANYLEFSIGFDDNNSSQEIFYRKQDNKILKGKVEGDKEYPEVEL